jgi:glycerophosphoryl diester phosphodiesterase
MAAFTVAAQAGADAIELDVRLCGSGELVVAHDPTLSRPTSGADTRSVAALRWDELRQVDMGGGERVPLLREVLAFCEARAISINVEMKRDVPSRLAVVRATARALRESRAVGRAIVSSFDPWMLATLRLLAPEIETGFLFGSDHRWLASGWLARPIGSIAVHPENTLVTAARCGIWRRMGARIHVWTVNDANEARALAALGVDAIITDVPGAIVVALK